MGSIYNPINNTFENINSRDGQKLIVCYQLAQQWREDTETPFDYIHTNNGERYKIHEKRGRDLLKEKGNILMSGGSKISKLIKDSLTTESMGADSLTTESMGADSLTTESMGADSLTTESIKSHKYKISIINDLDKVI